MAVSDLAPLLAREREGIVPLIGAGLALEAGLPTAEALAEALRERSGLEVDAAPGDFGAVCRGIEQAAGVRELQRLAAAAITAFDVTPTSSLAAIARCPSGLVLTTNYDGAIERSVAEIGKRPVPLGLDDERIGEPPREDEVLVVHLHGVVERPETMILTTAQRDVLLADEAFRSRLRALVLGRRLLALGLRLSAEEPHLRAELRTIGRLTGEKKPLAILPKNEIDPELSTLEADGRIELHRCDPSHDYLEVRQCAQLIAPSLLDPTEAIAAQAERVYPPFLDPPLLGPKQLADAGDRDPAVTVTMAEINLGSLADLEEMVDARRALLVGAPGRGKTWALRRLGELNAGRTVFLDLRDLHPDTAAPERAFAKFVARAGEAFDEGTPVPSIEALREGSFIFLLDGLEEAALPDHAAVVESILAAVEHWPQHSYLVATRPTSEAQRLLDTGFTRFVVEGSEGWGSRYLRASGITSEQVEHLYEVAPTIGPQLAIPRYAARIAGELREESEGIALASGALERLVRGEQKNLEEAAQRLGLELSALLSWARWLAAMIELRGETSATIEEIALLPAPEGHSSRATCEELVQVALLRDLPDRACFSAQVSQEALCADAILAGKDPLAEIKRVALAEIDGRLVFRDDIEHTLDLVFEGAPTELRSHLRGLDELRWARTQREGDPATMAEAIEVIRNWHRDRRLWIPYRGDNQLRGPGEAIKVLSRATPQALENCRAELLAECREGERTARGNAVELLSLLPQGEETESVLGELLADPDDVVRRHAAHSIEHFELSGLTEELWAAWERETDELALQAIGLALAETCEEHDLIASVGRLRQRRKGWQRISYRVLPRLELLSLAKLFATGSVGLDDVEEVLGSRLEKPEPFSADEAGALGEILLRGGPRLQHGKHHDRITAVVAEHPEAVLRGARGAAGDKTRWLDLAWAIDVDPALLARYAEGHLAEPINQLLERIQWRESAAGQVPAPQPPEEDEEFEEPESLAAFLAQGQIGEDQVPADYWLMKLPDEEETVQRRILELADGWYPEDAATVTNGFRGAVATWVALDQPVSEERWLEILAAGISQFSGEVAEWMARRWEDGLTAAVGGRVEALEKPYDLALAAKAILRWTPEVRATFIDRACRLNDDSLAITVLERLRELEDAEGLREVLASECGEEIEERALKELAQLGDIEAQRRLLEQILARVKTNPSAYEHYEARWLSSLSSPALVDLLGEILMATHRCGDASMFRRIIEAGIRNIGDMKCLALYDRLIADPKLEGGHFYWYQREALARSLARREVLKRLQSEELGT
jgi:hypothetical protein